MPGHEKQLIIYVFETTEINDGDLVELRIRTTDLRSAGLARLTGPPLPVLWGLLPTPSTIPINWNLPRLCGSLHLLSSCPASSPSSGNSFKLA